MFDSKAGKIFSFCLGLLFTAGFGYYGYKICFAPKDSFTHPSSYMKHHLGATIASGAVITLLLSAGFILGIILLATTFIKLVSNTAVSTNNLNLTM